MTTIAARVPYQIYKGVDAACTVQQFNSLPAEVSLPYKILSAEEILAASLTVVESDDDLRRRYAVSTIRAACSYLSLLASFVPLLSRSQSVKRIRVDYSLLARTVMLYNDSNKALIEMVRHMVESNTPAEQLSISELSDAEGAMAELEKKYRHEAKQKGEKVEMLRKVAPETASAAVAADAPTVEEGGGFTVREPDALDGTPAASSQPPSQPTQRLSAGRRSSSAASSAGDKVGRKRSRSATVHDSATAEVPTTDSGAGTLGTDASVPATHAKPAAKRAAARRKGSSMLVVGRLRALTNGEKKVVAMLNQMIDVLARVYANKFNDLIPVFDHLEERMRAVQAVIDAERAAFASREDKKPPEPFHETSLDVVAEALAASTQMFRDDEECRYELDEDVIHPIAHACLEVVNQIEGYATVPYQAPSAQDLQKKHAAREVAKAKREDAQRKVLERAKAKEELLLKKEEEKRLLRARLGGGSVDEEELQEDNAIKNPVPMGYVRYEKSLPLGSVALFEKALFLWTMIVSMPQPLFLSQMSFSLFLRGLQEDDQEANGLMEEIVRSLLDVSIEHVRVSSPSTPRIATRGKNWFDALAEFVGIASGNKKKRQQQKRQRTPSTTESDNDDSFDSNSDDSSSTNSSSKSSSASSSQDEGEDPENEEEQQASDNKSKVTKEETDADVATETAKEVGDSAAQPGESDAADELSPFEAELKETMQNVTELRSLASWGNVDMIDRLNLLQFCVLEAISSEQVKKEADKLFAQREEDTAELEKEVKDVRDEAEKEMKSILKSLSSTAAAAKAADAGNSKEEAQQDEFEEKKAHILSTADKKRKAAYARFHGRQDSDDVGAVIQPLGQDRYRRLYWRFPLDRNVFVQSTTDTAADFPLSPEPVELRRARLGTSLLLDDEQAEEALLLGSSRRRGAKVTEHAKDEQTAASADDANDDQQRTWGVIPASYLRTFIDGLDPRGEREAYLRKTLDEVEGYVRGMQEPQESKVTRARAHTFGYLNKLKAIF